MSAPGGGQQDEIGDLLRRLGPEPLVHELEAAGLSIRGDRCRCPFEGCVDKGKDARRNLQIFRSGKPHVFCFACSAGGDLVDVLQATRKITADEALAHIRGQPAPARPPLQLVQAAAVPEQSDRIKPEEVRRIWKDMLASDEECERYLDGRGLGDSVGLGLVKFATRQHPDKRVVVHAKREYRIAMLLTDVVGNERGVQMRLTRKSKGREEDPWMSVRGSAPGKGFFGAPQLIEASPIVCVTEGGADTLAVACWTHGQKGIAVVGLPGKDTGHKLANELEAAGIVVTGKLFLLFTQNDKPENKSRRSFERLRQLLVGRGARAIHVRLHDEYKDVADWLQTNHSAEWPPEDVREAFALTEEDEEGDSIQEDTPFAAVLPGGVQSDRWGQDFNTLCSLVRDPGHREGIVGRRGELTLSEMTHMVHVGSRPIDEADISVIRLRIEQYARAADNGKPLKFKEEDIAKALKIFSRQRTIHPVREWLASLQWDRVARLDLELAAALGQREGSFQATMLSRWMISAVARPMSPGCKVDTVLVLVGPQGIGKSSFFHALAGDDWFTDSPVNVGDKDGKMLMRKKWIVEWAELDAMRRARDKEAIRAFLSSRVDDFRAPYARDIISAPRACIIVGTTNNEQFLHDKERRFLPVDVSGIDLAWVRANREQLLAEAVHRYRAGERWSFTKEEMAELFELQTQHEEVDEWVSVIDDWVRRMDSDMPLAPIRALQVHDVLEKAIGKPAGQWVPGKETKRVADALRRLGWTGPQRRFGGEVGSWWVRPGTKEETWA